MSNKPYDKSEISCAFGHFDCNQTAGYTITNADGLSAPWYYIYQNRKILLYVDQNGPVKIQHNPPSGILLCKRELGENQSKWQVWVQADKLNEGVPVSAFGKPTLRHDLKKPKYTVQWLPEKAVYKSEYENVDVVSELIVPVDKATVVMKTTIVNKSNENMTFNVIPSLFPYVNMPQMVAWDLPEWYLKTSSMKNGRAFTIHGQMSDPGMDINKYHSVTFNVDYDENADFELNMSKFTGSGNFFAPNSVIDNLPFEQNMVNNENLTYSEKQAVWAVKYVKNVKAGDSVTFTQVLTVQNSHVFDQSENDYELNYFDKVHYENCIEKSKQFYNDLFSKRSIITNNQLYNDFINYFAPLQMYWVGSLDRGWPSSMRGTRDASQDFVGLVPLNHEWVKTTILQLLEHQRTDGWFPRQISTISRQAPHDMRNFCDGGAFFLELLYEYLTFTRDCDLLSESVVWLDSDKKNSVFEHVVKCVNYYLSAENIGEHGLCKAWHGDWWDVLDHVGSDGRGETVTVTEQMVLNLRYLTEIVSWLIKIGKLDNSYLKLVDDYSTARQKFINALKENAYNPSGYFNGYFNDNGEWLFSDNDPDGEKRLYLVSNAWGIISGVADKEMKDSVLKNIDEINFGRLGYNTYGPKFRKIIDKAGRVGNGAISQVCPYNHAQSFLVRACCVAGDSERAYKATRYILPIEQEYAPVEKTYAPPFCIANAYSNSEINLHRVELQFLSGTVSYVLRNVYSYFFGITFSFDGLTIKHCVPKEFDNCSAHFEYLGKKFKLIFKRTNKQEKTVRLNGCLWNKTAFCEEREKFFPFFADEDMKNKNIIEIEY